MIRVLIVDDHMIVRAGSVAVIELEEDMKVVGELAEGSDILAVYERTQPDVVLMDYRLINENGVELTKKIIEKNPKAKVLFLSVCDGENDIHRAVEAGAMGYLQKNADTEKLVKAIRKVAQREEFFPEAIKKKLEQQSKRRPLSKREIEVLSLLSKGFSNKDICSDLNLSMASVKTHVSNLLFKLDAVDRTQAVLIASSRGIVHLDL